MLIAFEGLDGAGKSTLTSQLVVSFEEVGYCVDKLAFPQYNTSPMGALILQALRGEAGDLIDSIYGMAHAFATDRLLVKEKLEEYAFSDSKKILFLDRYVSSNAAYSMGRVGERENFSLDNSCPSKSMLEVLHWIENLEFDTFGLPHADLTVYLDTPPAISHQRVEYRSSENDCDQDEYEKNSILQELTAYSYRYLAQEKWNSSWFTVHHDDMPSTICENIMRKLEL